MRATGFVRRIDDLGRVVIPREIRNSLGIIEGEPLEIFVDKENNMVCFQKYEINPDTILKQALQQLENCEDRDKIDSLRTHLRKKGYKV